MTERSLRIVLFALIATAYRCEPNREHVDLPFASQEICAAQPVEVDLTINDRLYLNRQPVDSASLLHWISSSLPQFPIDRRYLLIRVTGNARRQEIAWIASAADRQHVPVLLNDRNATTRCQLLSAT